MWLQRADAQIEEQAQAELWESEATVTESTMCVGRSEVANLPPACGTYALISLSLFFS